ncbi:MAG: hypothetical protein GY832_18710, partial [Chloroflexi bacterium]|nr:hypothetical protein [Chloroflexota bacterium]
MYRKLLFVFLILALLVSACGGGDKKEEVEPTSPPKKATQAPTDKPQQEPTQEPQERTLEDLGKEIGAVYVEALVQVIDLVKDKPPVAEVQPQVAALKEEYVQKLFVLGQERETFSKEIKLSMSLYIYQALDEFDADGTGWQSFNDATAHYAQEDADFNELLVNFSIIGQYAQFELLIDQAPEEAVRLGILDPSEIEPDEADVPTPTEPVVEEPPVEPAPVAELDWEPGWYAYTNGNDVKGLSLHEGTLYAAGAGGMVVWDIATGAYVKHTTLDGLLHVSAWDVTYCDMPEPRVIVATDVGLSFFDPASGDWDNTPITPEDSNIDGSDTDLVYCDAENGRLLIGYSGLGVLDFNSGEFTRYTDEEGLVWNGVRDVAVSGSDIWIASGYNGVSHISAGQVTAYDEDRG